MKQLSIDEVKAIAVVMEVFFKRNNVRYIRKETRNNSIYLEFLKYKLRISDHKPTLENREWDYNITSYADLKHVQGRIQQILNQRMKK